MDRVYRRLKRLPAAANDRNGIRLGILPLLTAAPNKQTVSAQASLEEALRLGEPDVLRLLTEGCSNKQIAESLILAEGKVKFYVHAFLEKLQVHSRTQAIARARALNLV